MMSNVAILVFFGSHRIQRGVWMEATTKAFSRIKKR